MKRRAVGGKTSFPWQNLSFCFFLFGSHMSRQVRGQEQSPDDSRLCICGWCVYLTGAHRENVQQSYKNWIEEEKKQDFALMDSQRVVAGKPQSFFFLLKSKEIFFIPWTANSVCVNRISLGRRAKKKKVNRKKKRAFCPDKIHTHMYTTHTPKL